MKFGFNYSSLSIFIYKKEIEKHLGNYDLIQKVLKIKLL